MRVTVFGPTGGLGRELIEQAAEAGHEVVAVARTPSALAALAARHEGLTVMRGDVLMPGSLAEAVAGADAVVSALGIGYRRHATSVFSLGTANIMAAMRDAGVRRLVCTSTTSLVVPAGATTVQRLVFRHLLQRMLRKPYADIALMERHVRESALDWTIVRAARLTNGARTGRYRTSVGGHVRAGWSISRRDLAGYMLALAGDGSGNRAIVEVAY
jgi:putative NADH-flavin reductase